MDKYKIVGKRCIALKDFGNVKKNDIGGLIDRYSNLSQDGDCWIFDGCQVSGNARIVDDACLHGRVHLFGSALAICDALLVGNFSDGSNLYNTGTYNEKIEEGDCGCENKRY